jgi:hypothetical protein
MYNIHCIMNTHRDELTFWSGACGPDLALSDLAVLSPTFASSFCFGSTAPCDVSRVQNQPPSFIVFDDDIAVATQTIYNMRFA